MLTRNSSPRIRSLQPRVALILLAALIAGCPDSIAPPKKPPPGPRTPDAPRVPTPKALSSASSLAPLKQASSPQTSTFHAATGKTALTVVPQSRQDSTMKRPP